jgi:hypothetical protein
MTTCTKSHFAKLISRSPSYITELIKQGRITLSDDGKRVEVEASLKMLADTASGTNPAVAARHEAERKQGRKKRKAVEITEGTRTHYEIQLQAIKNNHNQLDYELAIKKRFPMLAVRDEAQALGNTLRTSVEKLIDLSAPRLAALTDNAQRAQLLRVEIKQLTRLIKAEFPRAMRRLRK